MGLGFVGLAKVDSFDLEMDYSSFKNNSLLIRKINRLGAG